MSWSIVARNHRHVQLDIKPVGALVFCQVRLAAGRDMDSRKRLRVFCLRVLKVQHI
jgi:hypothetical protein